MKSLQGHTNEMKSLQGHTNAVRTVAFSPTGEKATSGRRENIKIRFG